MTLFWPERCAWCRLELPARGNKRRPIPSLGGRRRLVCATCADRLDEDVLTLDLPTAKRRDG